jgi:RNA polymerase sigma factor (sigma-70 family)
MPHAEAAPTRGRPGDDSRPIRSGGRTADENRELRAAIAARLSPEERLVVMLAYSERLNTREIAAVLGVSPGRVCELRHAVASACRPLLREPAAAHEPA